MIKYQFKAKNQKQKCNKYNILMKYFRFIVWIFWKEVILGEKKWKKDGSGRKERERGGVPTSSACVLRL